MKQIIINALLFEELSSEQQTKCLDKHRTMYVDDPYWYTCVTEEAKDRLKDLGFIDADINFTGFSSQGDGASFTAKIDLETMLERPEYKEFAPLKNYISDCDIEYSINRNSSRYAHELTCSVDYTIYVIVSEKISSLADNLREKLESIRLEQCHTIYTDLKDEYETQSSDGYLTENIINNEYHFHPETLEII